MTNITNQQSALAQVQNEYFSFNKPAIQAKIASSPIKTFDEEMLIEGFTEGAKKGDIQYWLFNLLPKMMEEFVSSDSFMNLDRCNKKSLFADYNNLRYLLETSDRFARCINAAEDLKSEKTTKVYNL